MLKVFNSVSFLLTSIFTNQQFQSHISTDPTFDMSFSIQPSRRLIINQDSFLTSNKYIKFRNPKLPNDFFQNHLTLTNKKMTLSDVFENSTQGNSPDSSSYTSRRVSRCRNLSNSEMGRYANTARQKNAEQNPTELLEQIITMNRKLKTTIRRHSIELQKQNPKKKQQQYLYFPPLVLKKDKRSFS